MGLLTTLTDANNNATTWSYTPPATDSWNVQQCDPASYCNQASIHWLTGLPNWVQDKAGIQTSFTYDVLQRVQKINFNSNNVTGFNQTNIQYTDDGLDRPTTITDTGGGSPSSPGNTQVIGYDLLDNVTSEQAPEGTVNYQYNKIIPSSMTPPGQPQASYTFDPANRLTNVTQQSPGTLAAAVPTYDGADRPTCVQLPNHVFASYVYDKGSRVTSITYGYSTTGSCPNAPTNLGNLTYSYDADSRIIGVGGSLAARICHRLPAKPPRIANATRC